MPFSYYDKDNNIKRLNIEIGKEWNSYKEQDSQNLMNSVFDFVDQNSDGKVDEKELDILQRLLKIADSQIEKSKNDNIIQNEELEVLIDNINQDDYWSLEENKHPSITTPKIINIPNDKDNLKNYTYVGNFCSKVATFTVDYSSLNNLSDGNYFVESWKENVTDNSITLVPVIRQIQESNQDGTSNWSEGINRNITKIQFDKSLKDYKKLITFMNKVGEEQGFTIEFLDSPYNWLEDLSIVRADKKQVIPDCNNCLMHDIKSREITGKRRHITVNEQGGALLGERADQYSHNIALNDIIQSQTSLEGGNVLNTLTKTGEPAVIIGEESLKYSMVDIIINDLGNDGEQLEKIEKMGLENQSEYKNKAIKQIALELGVKEENITFIPQFDFHIDMYYRPLNNGQMAVPDYEAGINILKDFVKNIDNEIGTNAENSASKNDSLYSQKQEYLNLITKLEEIKSKTETIAKDAEEELIRDGYEIVRIPCFSDIDKGGTLDTVENSINFMNGICGTSSKTGDKFYITNTSGDETLDKYMEKYFKEIIGFDKIYFAPTKAALKSLGGIDCLTKEF